MKTLVIFALTMACCFPYEVSAQSQSTRIIKLEVDGKEVKQDYRIFFLSRGIWTDAPKTSSGFTLPKEVEDEEYLTLIVAFGKHKLEFERVHISNFKVDWIVGVDSRPFSEEFVRAEDQRRVEQVYYLKFDGEPGRQLVVTKWKK